MRRLWTVLLVIFLVVTTGTIALAKEKSHHSKPGIEVVETVVVTRMVQAVDYQKRLLTLQNSSGDVLTIKVDDSVKNFNQLKQGDVIDTTYFESIAVFVEKKEGKPFAGDIGMVQVASPGEKPGLYAVNTAELTASVVGIDYMKRSVTLKGPEGKEVTLKVGKKVKHFKDIKKGDEVVVRHTEAVAIAVANR